MNGTTYSPALDHQRLARQEAKVHAAMIDGEWRTLREISAITRAPEASVSARLRGLRVYGLRVYGMTVERRRVGNPSYGVWEYRVLSPVVAP